MRSRVHWTPVNVAVRACTLLAPSTATRVLDVGAGVGKLCLIGAASTRAAWVGVEVDPEMVEAANHAAHLLGVADRALFVCGDANSIDWTAYDSLYFFNPFVEALFDGNVYAVPRLEFVANLERSHLQLERMRPNARVVTYHGFGGDMPSTFSLVHEEDAGEDHLCVWIRRPRGALG